MKQLHIWHWIISGFLRKHKKLMGLGLAVGIALSLFVIWVLPYIPRPNPTTKIALIGQYRRNQLPRFVTEKVGQGLTTILSDGSPAPALAYEWTLSEDGKTYTFFIRKGLFWQDDTPLTAYDLEYQFEGVETKVLDQWTIEFILQDSLTPFPTLVAQPSLKQSTIGTGEYRIRNLRDQSGWIEQMTLESDQETVHVKFYNSLDAAVVAFKLGEVDQIHDSVVNPFESEEGWLTHVEVESTTDTSQHVALYLTQREEGPFYGQNNKSFRQALAYAIQKPQNSSRSLTPISIDSWAFNHDVKPYDFEPQRALELLEKSFGSLEKARETTLTISTTQVFLSLAQQIKADWERALGIKVSIRVINSLSDDVEVLLTSAEIPPDPDQYSLWHSTQAQNIIEFDNPRVDKLLEDARREPNPEVRKELYHDFQRFFMEDSPVIFLYYPKIYTIKRPSIIKPWIRRIMDIRSR